MSPTNKDSGERQKPDAAHKSDDEQARQHQIDMVEACKTGDLQKLKELFSAAGVKQGDRPVEVSWSSDGSSILPVPASGPASTTHLLSSALEYEQVEIVRYLLTTYPEAGVTNVLQTALSHPNVAILELLYSRDPSIVDHEWDSGPTALQVACREGEPENDAAAVFLLDHGAEPNEVARGIFYPLENAIQHGKPLSLVTKLVESGAIVRANFICVAIREARFDVARYFLQECAISDGGDIATAVRAAARESGDEKLVAEVEIRVNSSSSIEEEQRKNKCGLKSSKKTTFSRRSWWPFGK